MSDLNLPTVSSDGEVAPPVETASKLSLPSKRSIFLRLLLSLVPLLVFVWILKKVKLPLLPDATVLGNVNWPLITVYGVGFFVSQLVRGVRWKWLVDAFTPISMRASLVLTAMGNAAIVLLPMRSGEVIRPLLARRQGISPIAAASTIGAERVIDGLVVGLLVTTFLSIAPGDPTRFAILPPQFRDPRLLSRVAKGALFGFSGALLALTLFFFQEPRMARLVDATVGRLSPRLSKAITTFSTKLASGLSFLRNRRSATGYLAFTALYWGMQAVLKHWLILGCGFTDVQFVESCAVLAVFALGFLLPSPPGFFGAFQTSLYAGLLLYFPTERVVREGSLVVFFAYAVQLGVTLLLGLLCYLSEVVRRARQLA
jgi:uncharacterized protein (TIRG00374 family)